MAECPLNTLLYTELEFLKTFTTYHNIQGVPEVAHHIESFKIQILFNYDSGFDLVDQ